MGTLSSLVNATHVFSVEEGIGLSNVVDSHLLQEGGKISRNDSSFSGTMAINIIVTVYLSHFRGDL